MDGSTMQRKHEKTVRPRNTPGRHVMPGHFAVQNDETGTRELLRTAVGRPARS